MKNNPIYQLSKEHIYHVKIPDCPLNIAISCDGSNAIIATTKKLTLLYFRKLFNREKAKKILKQEYCDIYKNIGPIQMHPFFDEKEYFAGAYENNLFIIKVSKNTLNINEAKKFTNQHYDNIKHIAWQNRQNGFLVSSSTDKLLNFYDIRSMTNPIFKIKDDDIVQSLKFSNANFSHLAAGYNKRLKIWDLKRIPNKTNLKPFFDEPIFNGNVNILDWHPTQNYLIAACSSEKTVKIYSVKEKLELLLSIFLPNFEEAGESNSKMIKSYFIPGNGVIIVKEKRAFIFATQNNYTEAYLDLKFDFEIPVTHFKIMTNNLNNQYFVYTDKENNFIVRLYTINENICKSFISASVNFEKENRGLPTSKKNIYAKEVENLKRKFATISILDNKLERNTFIIQLSQDLIIQINLKVIFPENYPNEIPSIEILDKQSFLIPKYLINNITQKLSEWEKKQYKNQNLLKYGMLEDLVAELMDLIEKSKFVNTFGEQEKESAKLLFNNRNKNQQHSIIPYPKTCSFTWNPNGELLTFSYHKIDFTQLKQTDKIISNFNDLDDWVKYCKSKDYRNNKFSKSENKLFEEENNVLVYDKLRDLVDWKSMIDSEENAILNSINRIESLPNLFTNNVALDIQQEHFSGSALVKKNLNMLFLEDLNFYAANAANGACAGAGNHASLMNNVHNSVSLCNLNHHNVFNDAYNSLCLVNENTPANNSMSLDYIGVGDNLNEEKKISYNINIYELESNKNKFYFLENIKIRLLSKDYFLQSIKDLVLKIKSEEASVLLDIIKLIDFNIDSIIDKVKTKKTMIKFYKNSIMTTLKSLEKNRNFEFLYLCILLIISRMRDDIDKFNENLTRMASNKSIYHQGNINSQNSPKKISELTLDLKKTKSNYLNNPNANEYFSNNLTSRNLTVKLENFDNNNNSRNPNDSSNAIKQMKNQFNNNSNNKTTNESFKTLDAEGKNKEKNLDFSFTNNQKSDSNINKADLISRTSTMANNTNTATTNANGTGSNNYLINGYTNVNRISPNINTILNQVAGKNSEKMHNNNGTTTNDDETNKQREKYLTIKDYFDNNESRGSGHFNSIAHNNVNNNNEKIILGKNQIRNITNDLTENFNSHRLSNDEKNYKEKDNDIANYFSKKPASNKKNYKNISLLNLRKGKEKDIDRESIFSIGNNLNFEYNKSPVMHPSNSSSYYNLLSKNSNGEKDLTLEKNEDGKNENIVLNRDNANVNRNLNSLYYSGACVSNLDLIGNSLGNRKSSKISILSEKLNNTERNLNMLNSTSRTNQNSNSIKGEKLTSNKNSGYDFARTSSYDDENNPSNFYDNYNISEHHRERASPEFLMGENLIDTKIPMHYQSPPNGPESDHHLRKMRNSNSNTNIDKLNYNTTLNVGNYMDINNNNNNYEKNSNKTINEINLTKNSELRQAGKNIDFQIDKRDLNNIVNKSFLAPNPNSRIPNQVNLQQDLVSNYSLSLHHRNNNNFKDNSYKSNPQLHKNENNFFNTNTNNNNYISAYQTDNRQNNTNRNTFSNKENKNVKSDFLDESLDLKFSNSNDFTAEHKNKLNSQDNFSANHARKDKQNQMDSLKSNIKKRNLVKIFGKSILSKFIDFLYHYSNELLRKKKMMERAELIKFLYLISTKLEINKFNSIFQNTFNNFVAIDNKQKTSVNGNLREREVSVRSTSNDSDYNKFLAYIQTIRYNEENEKEKLFKTNIMKPNEYSKCDICGERIRVDELSLYSTTYNMGGHFEHIINFINTMHLQRIYNK